MKLKVGDTVKITGGKDKGRQGKIDRVLPTDTKVVIKGINIYKRHVKPQGKDKPGGIVEVERPLSVANVAIICSKCNQVTRVGYKVTKGGGKVRICKKCQADLD